MTKRPPSEDRDQESAAGTLHSLLRALRAPAPAAVGATGLWLFWAFVICLSAAFLWSAFSGSSGFSSLVEQRETAEAINQENREILIQNQEIKKEIYLLRNSPSFLRRVAREELGYIAEGEEVYLPADSPASEDTSPPVTPPEEGTHRDVKPGHR